MRAHGRPPAPRRPAASTVRAGWRVLVAALALTASVPRPARAWSGDTGRKPPTVRMVVRDSAIVIPDLLPPGLVRLRLVSRGSRARRVVLSRLRPGQAATAYLRGVRRWLRGGHFGLWGEDPGSPGMVAPGDSADVIVPLHPGHYLVTTWSIGPGGRVRIQARIRAAFEVPSPPARLPPARAPAPDLSVRVTDRGYDFTGPLTPGHHVIHVVNRGAQEHDFQIARLLGDHTAGDARKWLEGGRRGAAPLEFVGGLVAVTPGLAGWADVTLTPGRYVVFCLVPDASDRKPHVEHGMLASVRVRAVGGADHPRVWPAVHHRRSGQQRVEGGLSRRARGQLPGLRVRARARDAAPVGEEAFRRGMHLYYHD